MALKCATFLQLLTGGFNSIESMKPKKIIQLPLPELPEETRQLLTFIAEVNANEIFNSNETGIHIHPRINGGSAQQLVNGRTGTSLPGVLPAQRVRRGSGVSRRSSLRSDVSDRQQLIAGSKTDEAARWQRYEAALPFLANLARIWEICPVEKKAQFLRLLFGESLEKTKTGYRTPHVNPAIKHNAHKVSALEIKSGTENTNFDASGSVCSPYGAKIEPIITGIGPLVEFLTQLKRA